MAGGGGREKRPFGGAVHIDVSEVMIHVAAGSLLLRGIVHP